MTEDIVERLTENGHLNNEDIEYAGDLELEAAAEITALRAEVEALKHDISQYIEITSAQGQEIIAAETERDAATAKLAELNTTGDE